MSVHPPVLGSSEVGGDFLTRARELTERAAKLIVQKRDAPRLFRVAQTVVAAHGLGAGRSMDLLAALRHCEIDPGSAPIDCRVAVIDTDVIPVMACPDLIAALPATGNLVHLSFAGGVSGAWEPQSRTLEIFHRDLQPYLYISHRPGDITAWERAAPLLRVLHAAVSATESAIMHAAAISDGRTGLLLAGPSGAGKSTTTVLAMANGFSTVGDDLVLVSPGNGGRPVVRALHNSIKLSPKTWSMVPMPAGIDWSPGDASEDKKVATLTGFGEHVFAKEFEVDAIVLPRVAEEGRGRIRRGSARDAFGAIWPMTQALLRGDEKELIAKISLLARSLPVFHLDLAHDPQQVVGDLRDLCDEVRK